MKNILLTLIIATTILSTGCTQSDKATRVLRAQGYTNIEITGWRPLMKSDSDTFSTGFKATSPSGAYVTGAVCSGWLKGSTIRLD